ncbi:MAG: GC-type dockerin domain-anchored protein [Phycisphaerales bacterium JB050]
MTVFDDGTGPAVFVAGTFETAGGVTVNNIAKWDGTNWSPLTGTNGTGVDDWVYAIEVFDDGTGPALYVGGSFETAGGITANSIAKWDGSDWSALSSGGQTGVSNSSIPQFAPVFTMEVHNDGIGDVLYVGGLFTDAGNQTVNNIARWDRSTWSPLSGGSSNGTNSSVRTIYSHGSSLYVGGAFTSAGGQAIQRIAKWNGNGWVAMGSGITGLWVNAITAFDDGSGPKIFAAGDLDGPPVKQWSGTGWASVTSAEVPTLFGSVETLTVHNDGTGEALYVAGDFNVPGNLLSGENIAKWDGSEWHRLNECGTIGPDIDDGIHALLSSGDLLYAGGASSAPGPQNVSVVRAWFCEEITCPGDPNQDGVVDLSDLNLVLANFGQESLCGDTNGDGVVNLADLNAVLASFGTNCN